MPYSEAFPAPSFAGLSEHYLIDETALTEKLAARAHLTASDRSAIQTRARTYVTALLEDAKQLTTVDAFLQ